MTQYKINHAKKDNWIDALAFSEGFGGKKIHVMKNSFYNGEDHWYSACGAGTVAVISSRTRTMQDSDHGVSTAEVVSAENFCARCVKKGYVLEVA
jgi:hypothetical protein